MADPRSIVLAIALVLPTLGACKNAPQATRCTCTPDNVARTKLRDGNVLDGAALITRLRRHRDDVAEHRTPRDIKIDDDELRLAIADYCQPCGDWITDRMTLEEMFPLARLDDAADAVCLGLVLRDGTRAYGDARPPVCR
jgi:hypothetical protein